MKNKNMICAFLGGAGFLLVYVVSGLITVFNFINLLIALVCGLAIWIGTAVILPGKDSGKLVLTSDGNSGADLSIKNAELDFYKIDQYRNIIYDPELNNTIGHITQTGKQILTNIKDKPELIDSVDKLIEFYVPTILKILSSYIKVRDHREKSEKILDFTQKVKENLKTIAKTFDKQLEKTFRDEIIDVSLEMDVMLDDLKMEGLLEDDFKI